MFTKNTLTDDVLDVITPEQTVQVARLTAASEIGLSSAGLIRWAAKGGGDVGTYEDFRPADDGDLRRCEQACTKAPEWLAEKMFPLLEVFREEVAKNNAEYEAKRRATPLVNAAEFNLIAGQTIRLAAAVAVAGNHSLH